MKKRICEWDDAMRMIANGTFGEFLQSWIDRYTANGRFGVLKEYNDLYKCGLEGLKAVKDNILMSRYSPRRLDLEFEIGPDCMLTRHAGVYTLLLKVKGIWTVYKDEVDLKKMPDLLKNCKGGFDIRSICDEYRLKKAGRTRKLKDLAKELWWEVRYTYKYLDTRDNYLFCDMEIWSKKDGDMIYIAHKGGFEMIPATIGAIKAHLEKHYERLDPTREPF